MSLDDQSKKSKDAALDAFRSTMNLLWTARPSQVVGNRSPDERFSEIIQAVGSLAVNIGGAVDAIEELHVDVPHDLKMDVPRDAPPVSIFIRNEVESREKVQQMMFTFFHAYVRYCMGNPVPKEDEAKISKLSKIVIPNPKSDWKKNLEEFYEIDEMVFGKIRLAWTMVNSEMGVNAFADRMVAYEFGKRFRPILNYNSKATEG